MCLHVINLTVGLNLMRVEFSVANARESENWRSLYLRWATLGEPQSFLCSSPCKESRFSLFVVANSYIYYALGVYLS